MLAEFAKFLTVRFWDTCLVPQVCDQRCGCVYCQPFTDAETGARWRATIPLGFETNLVVGANYSSAAAVCLTRCARFFARRCSALLHKGVEHMIPVVMEAKMTNPREWSGQLGGKLG